MQKCGCLARKRLGFSQLNQTRRRKARGCALPHQLEQLPLTARTCYPSAAVLSAPRHVVRVYSAALTHRRQTLRVIKASLRVGRAHGVLRAKLNRQFVSICIQVAPPRFAQAPVARPGREAHITAKNSEGPQLAPGAFQAQPTRAAHSSYIIRRLPTLFEPAQAFSVAVTTLEVGDVRTNKTPGDEKQALSHRIWTRYFY